ncbi:MAG TPA: sigma-70 family RNA polymerase sigma factor [Pirellulales bacterium]|jgi:RNA polymerase sigma-70 factor (ECF subfamily)
MEQSSRSDSELVAQTLAGNREAFGELYDRHARIVRAVVAGVSGDWPAVEDMTQECFLRAYRNLAKLRNLEGFRPWVVGIARQVAHERRRSLRRDRHEFQDPRVAEIGSAENSEADVDDHDEFDVVMKNLATLPEQERLAIHAFFLAEKDGGESAELVGLSRSGFYALLQRAVARLAVKLKLSDLEEEKR